MSLSDMPTISVAVLEADCDEFHDETKEAEKDTALHSAILQLAGDSDSDSTMSMLRFFRARNVPVISTGSLKLDTALGIGGLPRVSSLLVLVHCDYLNMQIQFNWLEL